MNSPAQTAQLEALLARAGVEEPWSALDQSARKILHRACQELHAPLPFPSPQCLITGCVLHNLSDGSWTWGDLHRFHSLFIFNGVTSLDGTAKWFNTPIPHEQKAVRFLDSDATFARRGVFILPATDAALNPAAREYLAKATPEAA